MAEIQPHQIEESSTRRASRSPNWRFLFHGVFWLLTTVAIVFMPEPDGNEFDYPIVGFLLGSIFGHTTGICFWASLGQGAHLFRGILAFVYTLGLWIALATHFDSDDFPDWEFLIIFGVAIGSQALLISGLGFLARVFVGLRLVSQETLLDLPVNFQFSIKQLMILTFAIALFLGVSREFFYGWATGILISI